MSLPVLCVSGSVSCRKTTQPSVHHSGGLLKHNALLQFAKDKRKLLHRAFGLSFDSDAQMDAFICRPQVNGILWGFFVVGLKAVTIRDLKGYPLAVKAVILIQQHPSRSPLLKQWCPADLLRGWERSSIPS